LSIPSDSEFYQNYRQAESLLPLLAHALYEAKESTASAEEVSIRDAQDFVRYCMAIVAGLSLDVDKLLEFPNYAGRITVLPRELIFLDESVLFKQNKEFSSKGGVRLQ
jgi:hypothetical protein